MIETEKKKKEFLRKAATTGASTATGAVGLTSLKNASPREIEELTPTIPNHLNQTLTNIKGILNAEGATMNDIIKTTVILSDIKFFSKLNEIYKTFFKEPYPARTTIGASLPGRVMIEIEAVAYKPKE